MAGCCLPPTLQVSLHEVPRQQAVCLCTVQSHICAGNRTECCLAGENSSRSVLFLTDELVCFFFLSTEIKAKVGWTKSWICDLQCEFVVVSVCLPGMWILHGFRSLFATFVHLVRSAIDKTWYPMIPQLIAMRLGVIFRMTCKLGWLFPLTYLGLFLFFF